MAASNSSKQSNSGRGFASMSKEEVRKNAAKGGSAQGKENNPANFANDREKAKRAGAEGGSQ